MKSLTVRESPAPLLLLTQQLRVQMPKERVTAYLSHSYRHADREVNDFFWKLFWANDVTFAVDSESERFLFL